MNLTCSVCKGSSYLNPTFQLETLPCNHKICFDCLQRLFSTSSTTGTVLCPVCAKPIRKGQITSQSFLFDDQMMHKEIAIRKQLSNLFSLQPSDFKSQQEYDSYQEQLEDYVFNLVNDFEVASTKEQLSKFEHANAARIAHRQIERKELMKKMAHDLEQERRDQEEKRQRYIEEQLSKLEEEQKRKNEMAKHLAEGMQLTPLSLDSTNESSTSHLISVFSSISTSAKPKQNSDAQTENGEKSEDVAQEEENASETVAPKFPATIPEKASAAISLAEERLLALSRQIMQNEEYPRPVDASVKSLDSASIAAFRHRKDKSGNPLSLDEIELALRGGGCDSDAPSIRCYQEYLASIFAKGTKVKKKKKKKDASSTSDVH
ncbi:CDK-activating kinase assembly factor MAT1 [Monocercomonoides exilis]|uniref:CDK-activating kinase assembly factor MAT1 n=1 Tax=Monocercomonoides exilis TaxID=2049356 RepID=UPI00355A7A70|nr:CDK-activating kinase assembly factor MAT1 [Monocercomonoides exilis]|eukprot:MONOS_1690.1-p1 / transcript=MONOS_1690.1 / gene=MONOS_1690 / organism=Monocercomonoides_exilis_PA203 / gene_product=CDK-activating kinase assembly factor MAT1 / transcript_product=CDK-activating kinase assembly factor MAT1 / location=Mono_scaffold00031:101726-102928(-) / protein_length=376 / sequence_SO=supercontig / SO=protein_coding / is_pseudo=false